MRNNGWLYLWLYWRGGRHDDAAHPHQRAGLRAEDGGGHQIENDNVADQGNSQEQIQDSCNFLHRDIHVSIPPFSGILPQCLLKVNAFLSFFDKNDVGGRGADGS